jgi:hypothetical protein
MLHADPLSRPTASQAVELLSVRRARRGPVPPTTATRLATAQQSSAGPQMLPVHQEMALAGRRQSELPADRPLNPMGPVPPTGLAIPAQEHHEESGGPVRTRMPFRAEGGQLKDKWKLLLVSAIAALVVAGTGIYAAVSAFTGPTLNQSGSTAKGSVSRPTSASGTGAAMAAERPRADPAAAKEIAYEMLPSFGFNQTTQYSCLVILWARVSNWNVYASNDAGYYGIPQARPGDAMAAAGQDWRTNAATQIKWGLSYIKETYGTPCGAWQYEESNGTY